MSRLKISDDLEWIKRENGLSGLERGVLRTIAVLHFYWPSNLILIQFPDYWEAAIYYMAVWLLGLTAMLFIGSVPSLLIGLVMFRIADIAQHRIHRVLFLRGRSPARAILTLLDHLCELTIAYAIIYAHCLCIWGPGRIVTSRSVDALYFSAVTMATVGYGDFVPSSGGRLLVLSQLSVEVLFAVAAAPEVIRLFSRCGGDVNRP